MANTGILYRRNVKAFFNDIDNKPVEGEIVYATDTHEYGALDEDGSITWRPHEGAVVSVNSRQGEIQLDKTDVGLSNVDNTSDKDKPLSDAIKKELKEHYEAVNPHHVTPAQIGLENVENTADIDKPISRLTQSALDLKLDKSAIPPNAKFTDTTYEIKDGELSEYNFKQEYKDKLDNLGSNRQLLSAGTALRSQGRNVILTRADGSEETIETQDTIYDDTNVLQSISNILTKFDSLNIKDNLSSEDGVLSAKQGKILNDKINEIKETLKSNNVDLDTLQEIVTFIENNRHLIDSLEIDNIANLRNVLNSKCDFVNEQGTVRNALNFDNHEISDFVMKTDYLTYKGNVDNSIAQINSKFSQYYNKTETDSKIKSAVDSIDYTGINNKIDNNFKTLNDKISAIDYTYISTDLNNAKTALEAKDLEIQTDVTNKYSELKTIINSINFAQINTDIANLNKLIKDNSLTDLSNNIKTNKEKIAEILETFELYLKVSDLTVQINKEYAQSIEPKINDKLTRYTLNTEFLKVKDLVQKIEASLKEKNSDIEEIEAYVDNIYHILHNFKVDLSEYYKKSEIDEKLKNVKASSIKEWNNTDTFKKGDLILYKGYLFRATEDSTGIEPTIDSKTSPYYSKEEVNDILDKRPLYNPNLLMNGSFCSFERQNKEFFDLQNMNNTDYLTDRWQVFSSVNDLKWSGGIYDAKTIRYAGIRKLSGSANIQLVQFIENITIFRTLEYVTISFEARAEKNKNISVHIHPVKGRFISSMQVVTKELTLTNQTKFYSVTLQVPNFWQFISNDANYDRTQYALAVKIDFGNEVNEPVFLQNIKLERGTTATTWTPYGGSEESDRQACLRYFERIRKRQHFNTYISTTNSEYTADVNFKVQKRIDDYRVDFTVNEAIGLKKGNVVDGIYPETVIGENKNKDGILFVTKIKNKHAYFENITIDADF